MDKAAKYREHLQESVGKTIFLRRKSSPDFLIIGKIEEVYEDSFFVNSEHNSFIVGFDDIYTADIRKNDRRKKK